MSRVAVVRAQRQVLGCSRCPLAGSNVAMVSPATAAYAVVGEAPGGREVQKGEPFVGPAGRRLRRALERAGLDADAGAYLNVVSCLPQRVPPTPWPREVAACVGNRVAQLDASEAEVVLACGNVALRCWRADVSIGVAWGTPLVRGDRVIVPSVHPSAVLRDPGQQWKLDRACEVLAMVVTGRGLAGVNLLGSRCMTCGVYAELLDKDCWSYCPRHLPKEMTDKERSKKMKAARIRVNEGRQGAMF